MVGTDSIDKAREKENGKNRGRNHLLIDLSDGRIADVSGQLDGKNEKSDNPADINEDLNYAEERRVQIKINAGQVQQTQSEPHRAMKNIARGHGQYRK